MAITSIFGIQSGFDTASLVEKLIALQARPLELKLAQLQAKETELEAFQSPGVGVPISGVFPVREPLPGDFLRINRAVRP